LSSWLMVAPGTEMMTARGRGWVVWVRWLMSLVSGILSVSCLWVIQKEETRAGEMKIESL
jgi:hypothetical protein